MVLTDSYSPDYGLFVEVSAGFVDITEAHYDDETNTTIVVRAYPSLKEVLKGKHRGCYGGDCPPFRSQKEKVLAAAISYIGYYGGDEELLRGYRLPELFTEKVL
jgi:hypothetical protein